MNEADIERHRDRGDINVSVVPASWIDDDEIVEGWIASSPGVETIGASDPDEAIRKIADAIEVAFHR